jgi:3-ketoacyl-CoA synthase
VLLSSKGSYARTAKYEVQHVVCTHMAADDEAYGCVQLTEDDARITGIRLKQELVSVAERALRQNMQDLGPLVLPLGEKLKFAVSYVARRLANSGGGLAGVLPAGLVERQYIPDFKKAFDFFCIHTGEPWSCFLDCQLHLEGKHASNHGQVCIFSSFHWASG